VKRRARNVVRGKEEKDERKNSARANKKEQHHPSKETLKKTLIHLGRSETWDLFIDNLREGSCWEGHDSGRRAPSLSEKFLTDKSYGSNLSGFPLKEEGR